MSTSLPRRLAWFSTSLLLTVCVAFVVPTLADDNRAAKQKQLDSLLKQIDKIKQAIDVKEDSKSKYIKQLKTIESSIGGINRDIGKIAVQVEARKQELSALKKTRLTHQRKLSRENELLAEQVYTAYTLGRQERVKLLFSQQGPETLQRNLVFYEYFSNARVDLISEVQASIDEIIRTEREIRALQQGLEQDQQALKAQKQKLDKDLAKRKNIVASLDKQLRQQGGNLSRLEDEARQLQNLIDSIQDIFDEAPASDFSQQAFASLRGKLAWPSKGKVRRLFGRKKPASGLRWQGVIIEAKNGTPVHAISHGRVAFADWLRGMGNLIIIDHGNSYLSLYGHNESLFKSAGEWVEAGDVIGTIGSSGGQKKAGLYFEIRKRGKPQNPTKWCKAGNRFASS